MYYTVIYVHMNIMYEKRFQLIIHKLLLRNEYLLKFCVRVQFDLERHSQMKEQTHPNEY